MPRSSILSATERDNLIALPEGKDDLIRHYSFTESDLSLVRQRRGDANRIGFAVQLCLLRYPGYALASDRPAPELVIEWIARQIRSDAATWPQYGARDETRREHFQELRAYLSLSAFGRLTSVRWCMTLPTSPCRPTKGWCSRRKLWTHYGSGASFCRRCRSLSGPARKR